jgi:hypothetical protein
MKVIPPTVVSCPATRKKNEVPNYSCNVMLRSGL